MAVVTPDQVTEVGLLNASAKATETSDSVLTGGIGDKIFFVRTVGFTGNLDIQASWDGGTTWVNARYTVRGSTAAEAATQLTYSADTANYVYVVAEGAPLMRVKSSSRTAGSVNAFFFRGHDAESVNVLDLTAILAADNMANPTAPQMLAHLMLWDGATWDRASTTLTADTELPAARLMADSLALPTAPDVLAQLMAHDGTNQDMVRLDNAGGTQGAVRVSLYLDNAAGTSPAATALRNAADNADAVTAVASGGVRSVSSLMLSNGTTWDRARAAASSGAGLGVLKVHSQNESATELLASAARTATAGTAGTAVTGLGSYKTATIFLDVTAAATEVDDTLNVRIQYSPDGGTTWDDLASFTQVLGNGGAKQFVYHHVNDMAPTNAMHAVNAATLAAGSVQNGVNFGDRLRVHWVIVDPGAGAVSFTFSVKAHFK